MLRKQQKAELEKLKLEHLEQYSIKGNEKDWSDALQKNKGILSIKRCDFTIPESILIFNYRCTTPITLMASVSGFSGEKRPTSEDLEIEEPKNSRGKKRKKNKF